MIQKIIINAYYNYNYNLSWKKFGSWSLDVAFEFIGKSSEKFDSTLSIFIL